MKIKIKKTNRLLPLQFINGPDEMPYDYYERTSFSYAEILPILKKYSNNSPHRKYREGDVYIEFIIGKSYFLLLATNKFNTMDLFVNKGKNFKEAIFVLKNKIL